MSMCFYCFDRGTTLNTSMWTSLPCSLHMNRSHPSRRVPLLWSRWRRPTFFWKPLMLSCLHQWCEICTKYHHDFHYLPNFDDPMIHAKLIKTRSSEDLINSSLLAILCALRSSHVVRMEQKCDSRWCEWLRCGQGLVSEKHHQSPV